MPSEDKVDRLADKLGMSEVQWQQFQTATNGYGEQDENGIDLSLLRANLRLTPTERFAAHRRALKLVWEIQRAGRAARH